MRRKQQNRRRCPAFCVIAAALGAMFGTVWAAEGVRVGTFPQDVRVQVKNLEQIQGNTRQVALTPDGVIYLSTTKGLYRQEGKSWRKIDVPVEFPLPMMACDPSGTLWLARGPVVIACGNRIESFSLPNGSHVVSIAPSKNGVLVGTKTELYKLRQGQFEALTLPRAARRNALSGVALSRRGDIAVVLGRRLFLQATGQSWRPVWPADSRRSWLFLQAPKITFDTRGRLWFASEQGVGALDLTTNQWSLYEGRDGLPYNHFTCIAPGEDGVIWFGTQRGAIRFDGASWAYRAGKRWLPGDEVRSIAVDRRGDAWIVTQAGPGIIERRPMTLDEKSEVFEKATNSRHNRYGYVSGSSLRVPGDLSTNVMTDSDNDGLWTAMYGAGECFRYATTKDPEAKRLAKRSFKALRFLSQVTGIPGFPARSILPTSGPDPNEHATAERDRRNQARDPLWKVIVPRWPKSADGKWYWKCDTSSDETDGHYFFYAVYYDLVAETPEEKAEVVKVVRAITDHFLRNNFCLVDHDGKPTRWAVFNPENLNLNFDWWEERGLNSLSMLSYLKVAEHMTGDPKYAKAARTLIEKHGYAQNVTLTKVTFPKWCINHSDDEMAFMCYYNLLKYENNPELRKTYLMGFHRSWQFETPERNPLFNFIYGAVSGDKRFGLEDGVDTLKRISLDLVSWSMRNSHRLDLTTQPKQTGAYRERVAASGGGVLPIEERPFLRWNGNPFTLDGGGGGRSEEDGALFLLPYWLGRYHGFIQDRK